MMRAINSVIAGCVLVLAGCAGGTDVPDAQGQLVRTLVSKVGGAGGQKAAPLPQLTPELIASLTIPSLEVSIEKTGDTAFLIPLADRRDGGPGALRTWRTADGSQVTLRQGVVVTTRGIEEDLGSTNANAAVRAILSRRSISGPRTLYITNGNNGTTSIDLQCEMRSVGPKIIEIVGRTISTLHLQENCTGAQDRVTYDYWVDRGDSTVWQSRQWIGPDVGYIRTRLLKK